MRGLANPQQVVREEAALALGLLGGHTALQVLTDVMNDNADGRKWCNSERPIHSRVRAMAAAGLGLAGDSSSIEPLRAIVENAELSADYSLQQLVILALGRMQSEQASVTPILLAAMDNRGIQRVSRAQAPIALAWLLNSDHASEEGTKAVRLTLPTLLERFRSDRTDTDLRRSLAISIGVIANTTDVDGIEALQQAILHDQDAQVRHFGLMALARIGAKDAGGPEHEQRLRELCAFLRLQLDQASPEQRSSPDWPSG